MSIAPNEDANESRIELTVPLLQSFVQQIGDVFQLHYLKSLNKPLSLWTKVYNIPETIKVLHYCIKINHWMTLKYDSINAPGISLFVNDCVKVAEHFGLPTEDRYMYITVDQGLVAKSDTLRTPGWHLDGLQWDEIATKVEADYQFIWSDALPTEFVDQSFDVSDIDISRHNVFDALAKQVNEESIYHFPENSLVLMNPYHVHRASYAQHDTYRRFLRLSFTKTPVTSKKMTLNPDIDYNYAIYSTTGEIPSHLQ